jgi:hypothetical protein
MLARNRSLTCRALDVGLSGCLRKYDNPAHLDPDRNTADIIIRKRDLFRSARVPAVILPSTWNLGPPPHGFQYWPQSESLGRRMQEFVDSQTQRDPAAKELSHLEKCLVDGQEEILAEAAYRKLIELRPKLDKTEDAHHRFNLLCFICCCNADRENEATEKEKELTAIPPEIIGEYWPKLISAAAYAATEWARKRMLQLVAKMRQIEQEWRDGFNAEK